MHSSRAFQLWAITLICFFALIVATPAFAQKRRGGPTRAVVVDERLSVLRDTPDLNGKFVRRISRGDDLYVLGMKTSADGINFYRVRVTSRSSGWLQSDAVVSTVRSGDDQRLWKLVQASEGFDRISRAQTFLELFTASPLRPTVLLALGDAAEEMAGRVTKEAQRRLSPDEIAKGTAPEFSYYQNFAGLDRYQRRNIGFRFDRIKKEFHYNGAAWSELIKKYPQSPETEQARQRLSGSVGPAK
ncbi:MAG: hypothetical protein ABIP75_00855 [Pyrinomonadaceae bacterium]